MKRKEKIKKQERRKKRVRKKMVGRLRLSVFRSGKHIYAQLIDDLKHKTIVAASDLDLKTSIRLNRIEKAREVGRFIAQKALRKKIKKVVFDRGCYKYHGRIKALAEGAREGGLEF